MSSVLPSDACRLCPALLPVWQYASRKRPGPRAFPFQKSIFGRPSQCRRVEPETCERSISQVAMGTPREAIVEVWQTSYIVHGHNFLPRTF